MPPCGNSAASFWSRFEFMSNQDYSDMIRQQFEHQSRQTSVYVAGRQVGHTLIWVKTEDTFHVATMLVHAARWFPQHRHHINNFENCIHTTFNLPP